MCPLLKQSNNLRKSTLYKQSWNSSLGWLLPKVAFTGAYNIGSNRQSYLYYWDGPRPHGFRLAPVMHASFEGSSSPGKTVTMTAPYGTNKSIIYGSLEGDIAAVIGAANTSLVWATSPGTEREAAMRATAKLLEPDIGYGLMLLEATEAAELLISPFNFLWKQAKKLNKPRTVKRNSKMKPSTPMKYASDAWLQLRYAIMPTVSDVNDICNHVAEALKPENKIYRKGGGVSGPKTSLRTSGVSLFYGIYVNWDSWTFTHKYNVSHVYYRITDIMEVERDRLGLGGAQMFSLLWEKVPFSFVFDWAIDIGTWLDAIVPKPQYQVLGQTNSLIEEKMGGIYTYMSSTSSAMTYASPCVTSLSWRNRTYTRGLENGSFTGLPPVNAKIVSLLRSVDAAALAFKPTSNLLSNLKRGK